MKIEDTFFSHPNKNYNDHISRIAQSFDDENHSVVAHYHDLGKLSNEFQAYISLVKEINESNNDFEKRRNKFKTTHTLESAYLYFCNQAKIKEEFLANFFAILKHHTSLSDISKDMNDYLSTIDNYVDNERLEIIKTIAKKSNIKFNDDIYEFIDYFDAISNEDFYKSINTFFLFKKRYSRLILADKFEAIFSQPYQNLPSLSHETINRHLTKIEHIINKKQKERPNEYRTKARETIFENFEKDTNSNIYLIKAPTGIGKTFIALELALKIAKIKGDKRRIITAIPFTSIIDQTHQEYENILGNGSVLKYHHLTKQKEPTEVDEKEQFSQKVFLSDIWHEHFIVTTFNQLLYTLFSNHNRDNVRLETLRDSVIIVDEVQNIPRTLLKSVSFIFNEFSKRYNIDFIIMSATMPNIYDEFENAQIVSNDSFYTEKNNRYILSYEENLGSYESLSEAIFHEEGSVLCVVNTIEKAKTLYKLIDNTDCYLLTTHQTPQHRKEIIELIKCRLKHGEKIILISTQLIEAGVDLDFDVGYREFAPFGSIIQMAGRVNREGKRGNPSEVMVFDYINGKEAPYHAIDLQADKIKELLKTPLEEINLLSNMDSYFVDIKYETTNVDLKKYMKNLEFQTLFMKLNENFMPKQPWKVSLFIEQKQDHFREFIENREAIFKKYENKFDATNKVKDLEKDLGLYTISVNNTLIKKLPHNIKELFGQFILPYGSKYYTKEGGFDLDLTITEEVFD